MSKTHVLIVEDDHGLREALEDTLLLGGYQVHAVESAESAMVALGQAPYDIVVSDIHMGGMSGMSLLKSVKAKYPNLPILLMTAYANLDGAVQAMRDGATDYLSKPFAPEVLLNLVGRYAPAQKVESKDPVVADPASIRMLALARKVAKSEASVMVLGPSGSGKEVLSRYIHDQSKRNDAPFVAINCAAIPENMLEATLFGYEKGAFTGAVQACPGKFEQAQDGTLLLDEITEMDLALQAKLLRVIQEREVERLGARKTISLNVRIIATSNRDLKLAVQEGKFREDLYYRLNVFPITWAPLCERIGDIIPLAKHMLQRHCATQNIPVPNLSSGAQHKLMQHRWPGNVRELENVIQRALILFEQEDIQAGDLMLENSSIEQVSSLTPGYSSVFSEDGLSAADEQAELEQDNKLLGCELRNQEHQIILDALQNNNGKRKEVAEKLGISPRTLRYKLARMRDSGIQVPC